MKNVTITQTAKDKIMK